MGFDPATAITTPGYHQDIVVPALEHARPARLHATLLALAGHAHATSADADQATSLAAVMSGEMPADLWDIGTSVTTAVSLYQHTVLTEAAQVLCTLWDALDPDPDPVLRPFPLIPASSPN